MRFDFRALLIAAALLLPVLFGIGGADAASDFMNWLPAVPTYTGTPGPTDYYAIVPNGQTTQKVPGTDLLWGAKNLSDLTSPPTARANLGLGALATQNSLLQSQLPAVTPTGAPDTITLQSLAARSVSPLEFGADNTGNTDVVSAFNAAITAIQAQNPGATLLVPPGKYLISGTSSINFNNVKIKCLGTSTNGSPPDPTKGAVFWITSTTASPFTIGSYAQMTGACTFYWPNQGYSPTSITVGASPFIYTNSTGEAEVVNVSGGTVSSIVAAGVTQHYMAGTFNVPNGQSITVTYSAAPTMAFWEPIQYPPLFNNTAGATWDFLDNLRVVNAYDLFTDATDAAYTAGVDIDHLHATAIHTYFRLAYNPEEFNIANTSWNDGQWLNQSFSEFYPEVWESWNGTVFDIFGNSNGAELNNGGVSNLHVVNSNSDIQNNFIHVEPWGNLSESSFTNLIVDSVATAVQVDDGGNLGGVKFDAKWYNFHVCSQFNGNNSTFCAADPDMPPLLNLTATGTVNGASITELAFTGQEDDAKGGILYLTGANVGTISLSDFKALGFCNTNPMIANCYGVQTQTSNTATNLILNGDVFSAESTGNSGFSTQGVYLNAIASATVSGNQFANLAQPVALNESAGTVSGSGNSSTGTLGATASSVTGSDGAAVHRLLYAAGSAWDKIPAPSVSACGAGASVATLSNDQDGGVTPGPSVTSCLLTFAQSYGSAAPRCQVVANGAGVPVPMSVVHTATQLEVYFGTGGPVSFDYRCHEPGT